MLEALAAGKAVVATPRAIEGLVVPVGKALLVGSTAEELAGHAVALLADDDARRRLGTAAYAWAERELDPDRIADRLEAQYDAVLMQP